ncbi:hypothetical protein [Mycobacterium sherrisii]|uniref:DUF4304 domain-containing protein n=1 Tax=Mycobacterium sherrisii TaxID=243061 RepID=A0A1E3S842_9MYCO|nr:hypothetical protein [Mycobacterium sherrisii]MCV7027932.1 hypothetical protein [Mycobacterium sherrisii]MEC4765562.1 hypothetical protein [Mycobacterium sherrisii]ODQ98333.1 hypothetical protein BHQ21_25955 [Mycobacterium sherrisii]ORW80353.1 hypothetical protein AWC25_03765 [Mycobacterium sherrisii]
MQEFLTKVRRIVEPLLSELGFQVDEFDADVDDWGRTGAVVYFRSVDCKIQNYDSSREGSINCMIAPLHALNVFGPHDQSGMWQYLPRFGLRQGVPLDAVRETALPDFPTTDQFLESVRGRIERYFPIAHAGILQMRGAEYWHPRP